MLGPASEADRNRAPPRGSGPGRLGERSFRKAQSAGADGGGQSLIEFMVICTTLTRPSGADLSLSFNAIYQFFDRPPEVVLRLLAVEKKEPPVPGARLLTSAKPRSTRFDGLRIEEAITRWRPRKPAAHHPTRPSAKNTSRLTSKNR